MPHADQSRDDDRRPATVLVVEDEPIVRHVMAEALRDLGVRVVEAGSADEAWDYVQAGGHADLVFTDHRMPGSMNGVQLAQRLKAERPHMRVVITSGHSWEADSVEPVIPKPYRLIETAMRLVALAGANQAREPSDDD